MSDKLVDALIKDMKRRRAFRRAWEAIVDECPEDADAIREEWIQLLDSLGVFDDGGMNEARDSGYREGRDEECRAILTWLDNSEWQSPALAMAAGDLATAIRSGLHRVKR